MVEIQRILFPTDFSEYAAAALPYLELFSRQFQAEVLFVHVLQEPVAMIPESALTVAPAAVNLPDLQTAAEESLDRLARQLSGLTTRTQVLYGPPADEIVRYAKEADVDMILMGTHGRTGFAHLLLGSVAEAVVRRAPCPTFTLRPEALRDHPPH